MCKHPIKENRFYRTKTIEVIDGKEILPVDGVHQSNVCLNCIAVTAPLFELNQKKMDLDLDLKINTWHVARSTRDVQGFMSIDCADALTRAITPQHDYRHLRSNR